MRQWQNQTTDDGSIHCLGNGRLCVYEQGPDLVQVFGPPYSAPAFYRFTLEMDEAVSDLSERRQGTAIWAHRVNVAGEPAGEITDFVDRDLACLVRRFMLSASLHFCLELNAPVEVTLTGTDLRGGALVLEVPAGRYFNHVYPFPTVVYQQITWQGAVEIAIIDQTHIRFDIKPGESILLFAGGPDYPQAVACSEEALKIPYGELYQRTQKGWQVFSQSRHDFDLQLPADLPLRGKLLQTIDDVAVMIKSQQSREGGILAGYNYHMAYVRDQYGTARGLLTLGHYSEAQVVLAFYWRIWQRYGAIHNGQAVGLDGVFHIHENDDVELTGYLIRQAFDLNAHRRDDDFLEEIFPMLEWAWYSQVKHLVGGMLPFNGDETYIAGGLLPRSAINDGSSEATLLFLTGGEKLVAWAEKNRRWPSSAVAEARRTLEKTRAAYNTNFVVDGRLVANNPARAARAKLPRFRHGVCEKCQEDPHRWYIVWTERSQNGRYLCPKCLAEEPLPPAEPNVYVLPSTALVPCYLKTDFVTVEILKPTIEDILSRFIHAGRNHNAQVSLVPDQQSKAVGYDYGFLLYALKALDDPRASEIYRQMMAVLDQTGAWVEYYRDDQPMGTRCRPWESAINLEAVLNWTLK